MGLTWEEVILKGIWEESFVYTESYWYMAELSEEVVVSDRITIFKRYLDKIIFPGEEFQK